MVGGAVVGAPGVGSVVGGAVVGGAPGVGVCDGVETVTELLLELIPSSFFALTSSAAPCSAFLLSPVFFSLLSFPPSPSSLLFFVFSLCSSSVDVPCSPGLYATRWNL